MLRVLAAGVLGGLFRDVTTKNIPFWQRAATVVIEAGFAVYDTPIIVPIARHLAVTFNAIDSSAGFSNGSMEGLVSLLLGLIGFSVFDGLVTWSRQFRAEPTRFRPFRRKGKQKL